MVTFATIILISTLLIQLFYWWIVFKPLAQYSNTKTTTNEAVTILVCAKNEADNLEKNIPSWLSQSHEPCETLIVDDFSGIKTRHLIEKMRQKERYLLYYKVKSNKVGKKQALIEGLSNCRHNYVVFTDADCYPASPEWISYMMSTSKEQVADIVLGYSPYTQTDKTLLNDWIQYETWYTGITYLGFALKGWPYMGVGRNILYKRSILREDIITKHELSAGDDDLTVNQLATKENTAICLHPKSHVFSIPKNNWRDYFQQKRRHLSTPNYYKSAHKLLLMGLSVSHILFFISVIYLLFTPLYLIAGFTFLSRAIVVGSVARLLLKKLQSPLGLFDFYKMDLLHHLYYFVFSFAIIFPQKKSW